MGDKWSGLSGPSLKGSVGQGVEGLAWPFVKGPARQQRSEASMSASGEGRAATPSLFTLSSSLPEVSCRPLNAGPWEVAPAGFIFPILRDMFPQTEVICLCIVV
jgi:hypothetical protein